MRIFYTKELIFFIFFIFAANIYGQGTIQGVVTDSLTNDPLVGANIYLSGTSIGTAVNNEGEYRITRIPYGQYSVRISYIGYKPKEISLNINSDNVFELNVQLVQDIIEGEEVIISDQAIGQAAAINQQLNANTIVNVVSEQKIQELPDPNAAETIGRLPGVSLIRSGGEATQVVMRGLSSKFSTITIDGVRISPTAENDRGVDLSMISQGSLSGIELFKALTPDKDADAIAGSVNLVTRKAPSERLVRLDALGNYNNLEESAGQYNFIGRYGERFFDDLLGVQLIGNLERRIRSNETTDYNYIGTGDLSDYRIEEFLMTYSDEIRERGGGSILLDINTPDNGSIRLNNVYNETSRNWLTHNRIYPYTTNVTYDYRERESEITNFNSSLRGQNYLFGFEADWNLAFSESEVNTPYDYQLTFTEPDGMNSIPQEYWKGPVDEWIPLAKNNFSNGAQLNTGWDRHSRNYDKEKTAFLNILREYLISSDITGQFKFGGKYRSKSRSYTPYESIFQYYLNAVPRYVRLEDGTFVQKDFTGSRFDGLVGVQGPAFSNFLPDDPDNRDLFDKYNLYPLVDRDALKLWRELNINGYVNPIVDQFNTNAQYNQNFGIFGNGYDVTESILAGYIMNTLNLGSMFTLIAGVRVEVDDNDYSGIYSPIKIGGYNWAPYGILRKADVNHKETSVHPNFQAIIKPTDFMNIRLAGYKALARPDFNQRLPRFVAAAASAPFLRLGNPDLRNAEAWNFEVQTQFYGNDIGLFSINVFYKDIKDMYHTLTNIRVTGQTLVDSLGINWQRYVGENPYPFTATQSHDLTYPYNSTKPTRVWGFEVEHQANFRFLPGLLKNIVLDYNFSIVRSETYIIFQRDIEIPRPPLPPIRTRVLVEEKRKLPEQPELFTKAALGYDYEGFSFRVSLYYQGGYDRTFSANQRDDGVTNSFTRWDIAVKQKVTNFLSLILNLNNITNTKESNSRINRVADWGGNLEDISELYGFTIDFGARLEL